MSGLFPGEHLVFSSGEKEIIKFYDDKYSVIVTNRRVILNRKKGEIQTIDLVDYDRVSYEKVSRIWKKGKITFEGERPIRMEGDEDDMENLFNIVSEQLDEIHTSLIPPEGITGEVAKFDEIPEIGGGKTLRFLLKSFDRQGNALPELSVEMTGTIIENTVREGDKVRLVSGWMQGRMVRVSEIFNITTGVTVQASNEAPE